MRRRDLLAAAPGLLLAPGFASAQPRTAFPPLAVRRLIQAARLYGPDAVARRWPGTPTAEFRVLLIGPTQETLFKPAPATPSGFTSAGRDPVTGLFLSTRPRQFATNLLATFPAAEGVPTIVIGLPEATSQSDPRDWTLTLLHEHFHQHQYSAPGYNARADALDLSGGDQTGMWMLNYPFPYPAAAAAFAAASRALARALQGGSPAPFLAARVQLRAAVPERDRRYFAFQVWQEGVARFAEIDMGLISPRADWRTAATAKRVQVLTGLQSPDLAGLQRVAFYAYGAGEAMLLDRLRPAWRRDYFGGALSLDRHFAALGGRL